jgi:hypothetical protein
MIAAILNDYTIIEVGGTQDLPVVAIKATGKFHYESLQKSDRYKLLEWALKIELNQECRVRLVPPGQSLPLAGQLPPPSLPAFKPNDGSSRSANITMTIIPSQSAHREWTTPEVSPSPPSSAKQREPEMLQQQESKADVAEEKKFPLARTQVMRENTTKVVTEIGESHQEMIRQNAKSDPVVQEVVRMFKANIKDIHFK